jgi:excisionase family DNA binding protein
MQARKGTLPTIRLESKDLPSVEEAAALRSTTMATQPVLVTVDQVALMLSIGRTAAWELVRKGTIKSVKIGRTRRVPVTFIQKYIQQLLDEEVA